MDKFPFESVSPTAADFFVLLSPLGVKGHRVQNLFEKVVRAYREEGRFYHTLAHVGQVVRVIEFLYAEGEFDLERDTRLALRLAAWFHDVVYDPRRDDNEKRSAQWTEQELRSLRISENIIQEASNMILATRNHVAAFDDLPTQMLLDADLSILGAPPAIYAQYADAILKEYAFLPDNTYRAGRCAVLERFRARPRIYFIEIAYQKWEKQARENLQREIASLLQS